MTDVTDISEKKTKSLKREKQAEKRANILVQELTMGQIMAAFTGAQQLMGLVQGTVAAIQLGRIYRVLKGEAEEFQKGLTVLIEEYSVKDEGGKPVRPSPDRIKIDDARLEAYNEAYKKLQAETTEVRLNPVKLSQLGELPDQNVGWALNGLLDAGLLIGLEELDDTEE